MLLPADLGDLIATNHPVRIVNAVLDKIDIAPVVRLYKPGGTSSYHPRMLLKVLVYAYINNIYSSRKIEEAVSQNIYFMWLSGMSRPDHNTINRFRGVRLQDSLKPIFHQVVLLLCEEGLLNIKDLYTDGTKIEANANRYTFVWGKAIKRSRERIKQQLHELWKYAQTIAANELPDTDPSGFDKVESEKVEQTINSINEALKEKQVDNKVKQKLNYAKRNWPAALKKYDEQERIIGSKTRSSFSKTDKDATFMRMKDDHMRNGQLKPAYNVQISTNNQFIANYTIHQHTTDTNTLIEHIADYARNYRQTPSSVTADAGYGSEENYKWLDKKRITVYVKHNQFDRSQNKTIRNKSLYSVDKMVYDEKKNQYICPSGQPMKHVKTRTRITTTGYEQILDFYQASKCSGCPLKEQCHSQEGNRMIQVSHELKRLKAQAERRLKSKKGVKKRKQRCFDTEPVFANIKHNHNFKRFMLRGIKKVNIESGLLALAHNLRKKVA